jgi:hypothetical protein
MIPAGTCQTCELKKNGTVEGRGENVIRKATPSVDDDKKDKRQ